MTKKKDPKDLKKAGRHTIFSPEIVAKLEQGFKIGLNDTECCAYVEVSRSAFYEFLEKNPEFKDKKEEWKLNPIAKAKYTIYKNLDDPNTAKWYAERKCKEEFSTKQVTDINATGINIQVASEKDKKTIEDL